VHIEVLYALLDLYVTDFAVNSLQHCKQHSNNFHRSKTHKKIAELEATLK